jgi:hypothetical protein
MQDLYLFGKSGIDKIKRLKANISKEYKAGYAQISHLKKCIDKNRQKRNTLTGYKRILECTLLDEQCKKYQFQVDTLSNGEAYKTYMANIEVINDAVNQEMLMQTKLNEIFTNASSDSSKGAAVMSEEWIKSAMKNVNISDMTALCKDAFVKCKQMGLFTKEMSVPSFINRDYCGDCKTPFFQMSETKVACTNCGCLEGNTEVPLSILYEEVPPPYDRRNYFEDVLDMFHEKPELPELKQLANEIMTEVWLDRTRMECKATGASIKKHLERIGKTRYTKYCNQIANYINHETVPIITPDQEFKSLLVFLDLLGSFKRLKTDDRSSFPNYHLLFRLICHMFGWNQFIPYLTMLRTEDKKEDQLKLLKLMFVDRGYPWPKEIEL